MKIELITEDDHKFLIKAFDEYPKLVFQNDGYEYIKKSELSEQDLAMITALEVLLKEHIAGFRSFTNFRLTKKGEKQIRFQYNYNYEPGSGIPFIGVGYIKIDELLKGFEE